jgi:hypothetical protein
MQITRARESKAWGRAAGGSMRDEGGARVPRAAVVEVVGREGRQGRRDCGRREMGLGLELDATLYTKETR